MSVPHDDLSPSRLHRRAALGAILAFGLLAPQSIRAQEAKGDGDKDKDKAVAEIQKAGGKVERDDKAADKPVLIVNMATLQDVDAPLANVKGFDKLQKLTLNSTKLTDAGLAHVKGLTNLKKLYLVDTKITDAGLENLKELKELQVLSLAGTAVTDAGLEHLKGLANLQTLFVFGTKVTDAGTKKLQEAIPKLKIEK